MRTICWSLKGGSGTTTAAVALAVLAADRGGPTTIVDLDGDVAPLLGLAADGPGLHDWFVSAPTVGAEAIDHLLVDFGRNLTVLHGRRPVEPVRADRLTDLRAWLGAQPGDVIVDVGSVDRSTPLLDALFHDDARSLLVIRACYLALLRATTSPYRPDGVVLVRDPDRGLDADDVEAAVGAPVIATVDVHPSVARALDAGTFASRLPRQLRRGLQRAA